MNGSSSLIIYDGGREAIHGEEEALEGRISLRCGEYEDEWLWELDAGHRSMRGRCY